MDNLHREMIAQKYGDERRTAIVEEPVEEVILDLDALFEQAATLQAQAAAYKETIHGGTKEQWDAWECLNDAANRIVSAVHWLHVHNEKHPREVARVTAEMQEYFDEQIKTGGGTSLQQDEGSSNIPPS